jgi:tetratricopeptide (TPR) repeat protein
VFTNSGADGMNLEALKEKARRHELKEEWKKALDAYRQVILKQKADDTPDIALYNRIGDIQTRMRRIEAAVESYEKAIDLYLEAELPNNAIAICKKVLRNLPDRSVFFLRMGQIRGMQGFLTDAKQNFLTYAEQMTGAGELDSAMDALVELVGLAPDDVDIRLGLASQLESHGRAEEALEQYTEAYRHLIVQEREEEAEALSEKLRGLDEDLVLPDSETIRAMAASQAPRESRDTESGWGAFELGSGIRDSRAAPAGAGEMDEGERGGEETPGSEEERDVSTGDLASVGAGDVLAGDEEEGAEPLPIMSFEAEEEPLPVFDAPESGPEADDLVLSSPGADAGEEGTEGGLATTEMDYEEAGEILRTFGLEEEELAEAVPAFAEEEDSGGEEELPFFDFGEEEEEGAPTVPSPDEALDRAVEDAAFEAAMERLEAGPLPEEGVQSVSPHEDAAERGDMDEAIQLVRAEIASHPDEVALCQRQVEYAFRKGDTNVLLSAYLDLAGCLLRTGSHAKARAVFRQVLSLAPGHPDAMAGLQELEVAPAGTPPGQVASSEEYVDLGSLILGDEEEKTTRWQVTAETPSGDDQADFAKMLNQFKQKVSEHVDAGDVSAHHDLGTAYLEMGLLDEAISEFQMALRASPEHLPTHEVMGRCWMEKGQPDMAARALKRALDVEFEVEDELIGIYYLMGKAQEELGNTEEAVEFYEKVFSLDSNFQDVTERLRSLR